MRYADGRRGRCDAACHHARRRRCPCVCGGTYHGAAEWGPGLAATVRELHQLLLARLGVLEQTGALTILAWRETLDGPLVWRRDLLAGARIAQLTLALPPAPGSPGAPDA